MSTVTEIEVDKATFDKVQEAWSDVNPRDREVWREHDPIVNLLLDLLTLAPREIFVRFVCDDRKIVMSKKAERFWQCSLSSLPKILIQFRVGG